MGMGNSIGATTFSTPTDLELVTTRVFQAPRRLVWDAWTSPEHLPRWLTGPEGWAMPTCEIDLRPGGAWHFGWAQPDGQTMEMRGVYRQVVPPERLVSTESWGGDWPETVNTVELTEESGRSTMTLTVAYPSKEARERAAGTGMQEGMAMSFDRLAQYLRTTG